MIANEYGRPDGEISATHHEYREARKLGLPTIVFLKGAKDDARSPEIRELIAETKKDGFTYKRFHDREDLKPLMLQALQHLLAEEFELTDRSAALDRKLALIGETVQTLLAMIEARRSRTLEIAIVVFIGMELLTALYALIFK